MGIDGIFPNGLLLQDALQLLWPVLAVVVGMTVYAVFVFHFYRFVAARDMFRLNLSGRGEAGGSLPGDLFRLVWWVVRFVFLYPAFAFFWLAVLTLVLAFLSEGRTLDSVLLIAMATVCAIRVAAYYNEDLSRDLSKMLPFAVLSFFIVTADSLDAIGSLAALGEVSEHGDTIFYYLLFLVALELVLRFLFVIFKFLFPGKQEAETASSAHRPFPRQSPQSGPRTVNPPTRPRRAEPGERIRRGFGNSTAGSSRREPTALVADESGQQTSIVAGFVPNGYRRPLNLVILEVAHGNADPIFGTELPTLPGVIGYQQPAEVARVFGLSFYQVNVPRNLGQLGVERIPVSMPRRAVPRRTRPAVVAPGQRRQQDNPKQSGGNQGRHAMASVRLHGSNCSKSCRLALSLRTAPAPGYRIRANRPAGRNGCKWQQSA